MISYKIGKCEFPCRRDVRSDSFLLTSFPCRRDVRSESFALYDIRADKMLCKIVIRVITYSHICHIIQKSECTILIRVCKD